MTNVPTIWIDLDNSPHVPFFVPIIKELESRGCRVLVTTRDCFQVCSLADYHGVRHRRIGRHYGANRLLKIAGTIWRSAQLMPTILRGRPSVSMSHGSRSLILLSSVLKIPTILLFDYEHAARLPLLKPILGIAPAAIRDPQLARHFQRGVKSYQGLKEDVYAASFKPDPAILSDLGLCGDDIVVTVRPPATEAHYHHVDSERLFVAVVDHLGNQPSVRMVILPRHERTQGEMIRKTWPAWCEQGKIIIPTHVVDGLNLVWYSDLVVSAGGTMNREAAALGVPVYSIFRGKIGAVDRYLAEKGRLTLVETVGEVGEKILAVKRTNGTSSPGSQKVALQQIVDAAEEIIRETQRGGRGWFSLSKSRHAAPPEAAPAKCHNTERQW